MNRFIMHISWIDAKIVNQTLTSIENAYAYSNVPTEFIILLNEQTFVDTPLEKTPNQQWDYFKNHPFLKKCEIITKTNDDSFWGVARFRREFLNKNGLTYWGESDCMLPLEYFNIAEQFDNFQPKNLPYVLSFAVRKMWDGWESIEHPSIKHETLNTLPKNHFMRCDSMFNEIKNLYDFNESQGNPSIIKLDKPRIEGALTILKNMPDDIICPDIDFFHEDYCLELMLQYHNINQYHVENIIKGHDNYNPDKRTNIDNAMTRNPKAVERQNQNKSAMISYIQSKFKNKYE